MKSFISIVKSDHVWRIVIGILAVLVFTQLFSCRRIYEVTVFTYRRLSYGQNGFDQQSIDQSQSHQFLEQFNEGTLKEHEGTHEGTGWEMNSPTDSGLVDGSSMAQFVSIDGINAAQSVSMDGNNGIDQSGDQWYSATSRSTHISVQASSSVAPVMDSTEKVPGQGVCNPKLVSLFVNENRSEFGTSPGGEWSPSNCLPVGHVALIIPFRDRQSHLDVFLPYMHSFLQRQQLHYRIFVLEQNDTASFNRAKLMNVGYREASKRANYTCYVFHDVDLLPLDERILYNCSLAGPIHLASAMDKFGFNMPYNGFFGGACSLTPGQIEKINGFSNKFFGWGGEDDDIDGRISASGQTAQRYPLQIARYHMIKHGADKGNEANPERHKLLQKTKVNWRSDGLNSLKYKVIHVEENTLYTKVSVDISATLE